MLSSRIFVFQDKQHAKEDATVPTLTPLHLDPHPLAMSYWISIVFLKIMS